MRTIVFGPGAVAAGTAISLPSGTPPLQEIVSAQMVTMSDGTVAGAVADLAVVTAAPAAGEIQLSSPTQVVLGDATTTASILIIHAVAYGEQLLAA